MSILRLPHETLEVIFLLSLKKDSLKIMSQDLSYVLRVCGHWKDSATSMPFLWSYIDVTVDVGTRATEIVELWLKRSRNVPLSIHISWAYYSDGRGLSYGRTMDLFVEQVHRWKYASFNLKRLTGPVPTRTIPIEGAAALELLKIACHVPVESLNAELRPVQSGNLLNSPNLTELAYFGMGVRSVVDLDWPVPNLTKLHLFFHNAHDVLILLRLNPKLTHMACKNIRSSETEDEYQHVKHESSVCLLFRADGENAIVFVDFLTLPNLLELDAENSYGSEFFAEKISGLLERSHCPLSRLIYTELGGINIEGLIRILEKVSETLTTVTLDTVKDPLCTGELFSALTPVSPLFLDLDLACL